MDGVGLGDAPASAAGYEPRCRPEETGGKGSAPSRSRRAGRHRHGRSISRGRAETAASLIIRPRAGGYNQCAEGRTVVGMAPERVLTAQVYRRHFAGLERQPSLRMVS